MKHFIDPTVDCVFKAILGSEDHKGLLINFLNAIIQPETPIESVEILNPYNEKEFLEDKLTIVDVKSRDQKGNVFQVEIQLCNHPSLSNRMLYTWSDLYQSTLNDGDDFSELKPVISIWLLTHSLFPQTDDYHLSFGVYDLKNEIQLSSHFSIHVVQLSKWMSQSVLNDKERWIYFFREGKNLRIDNLPNFLKTREMEEAMNILKAFSEKEKDYHLYQSRLNAKRIQLTWEQEIQKTQAKLKEERAKKEKERAEKEAERAAKEKERAEKEAERAEKEKALNELQALKEKLKKAGLE